MNIDDAGKAKYALQSTLVKMLRDYEDATGLTVTDISMSYEQSMCAEFGRIKYVNIRSELR